MADTEHDDEAHDGDPIEVPGFGDWLYAKLADGAKPDAAVLLNQYVKAVKGEVDALAPYKQPRASARILAAEERQHAEQVRVTQAPGRQRSAEGGKADT